MNELQTEVHTCCVAACSYQGSKTSEVRDLLMKEGWVDVPGVCALGSHSHGPIASRPDR